MFHNPFLKKGNSTFLFFQDPTVYNPEKKYYECNITPTIVEYFRKETLLIAGFNLYEQKKRLRFPETTFLVKPVLQVTFVNRLGIYKKKDLVSKIQIEVEYICEKINQYFSKDLIQEKIFIKIYYNYIIWKIFSKYYDRLLRKKKPKVIIEQCYYSIYKMTLNEVAKKQNIPVIELQHGVMGKAHPAYNILYKNSTAFPDYVFLFSELWKTYTRLPIKKEQIIVTGSCNLEEKKEKYLKKGKNILSKKIILFIGQNRKELFEYALEACKIIKEKNLTNYLIYYKLHPNFGEFVYEFKNQSKEYKDIMNIYTAQEKDLYECFSEAQLQVAESSTGLYEGLAFGLKTYIVPTFPFLENISESVKPLVDLGYAKIIKDIHEIFEDKDKNKKDISLLWEENAKENVIKEIRKIVNNHS